MTLWPVIYDNSASGPAGLSYSADSLFSAGVEMSHAPHFQNAALGFELAAARRPSGKRPAPL